MEIKTWSERAQAFPMSQRLDERTFMREEIMDLRLEIERQAQEIAALKATAPVAMPNDGLVPLSVDGKYVWLEGIGAVALDYSSVKSLSDIQDAATSVAHQGAISAAKDPIRELIALHAQELDQNDYAYFELARTRRTDWMAWICTNLVDNDPGRKVLATGQGDTPEEACSNAIMDYDERAKDQPQ